jgi:hypothetical protein
MANYRICVDFALWSFPHDHFPPSWVRATPIDDAGFGGSSWTDIIRIKQRDLNCRILNWADNKSTARIVPADQMKWVCHLPLALAGIVTNPFSQMQTNGMVVYAARADEGFLHADSRNLFALRWDIFSI